MKKSFKFSAILLALITSVSGLAPIGAVPPLKPDAKSEEKSKEMPQKRAREEEDSEEKSTENPQKRAREEKLSQFRKPLLTLSQLPEKQKELIKLVDARQKIVNSECYMLQLSYFLFPGEHTTLIYELPEKRFINLNEVKARFVESMEGVSSDIETFLHIINNHSVPYARDCRTPNQLTALSLITMLCYLRIRTAEENGPRFDPNFTEVGRDRLCYLLAISKFDKDLFSMKPKFDLDNDTPPDSFLYDAMDITYHHSERSLEMHFYLDDDEVYASILKD